PLPAALASPDPIGNFVRPVGRQLWFWLISRLGESAALGHALNLALLLGVVALAYHVARRLAGPRAAAFAGAILALSYVTDVPVRWVSGSQDLLATLGALGALALFLGGQRWLAALAFGLAMLAKETVLLTPLIAAFAARKPGERWRASLVRAWPLGLVAGGWAVLWLGVLRRHAGRTLAFSADALPA